MMGSMRNKVGLWNIYGYRKRWGIVKNEIGGDIFVKKMENMGKMESDIEDIVMMIEVMEEKY